MSIARRTDFRPPAAPAEIVASIARPAALQLAERNLASLRKTRDETEDERNALYRLPAGLAGRRIWEINNRKATIDAEVTAARQHAAALRVKHEKAVRAALAPMRSDAIARFNEAYSALLSAWEGLDEIEAATSSALAQGARTRMTAQQFQLIARGWLSGVTTA